MIHRALLGSIERFMAILLEHCGGDLPLWLAPVQVRLITVTDQQHEYAQRVLSQLRAAGLRAEADLRNEKLGYKIREAEVQKVPIVLVIGDKEVAAGTVAPRRRGSGTLPSTDVATFVQATLTESRPTIPGGVP
jgi:threonyl-tRNA synthetase